MSFERNEDNSGFEYKPQNTENDKNKTSKGENMMMALGICLFAMFFFFMFFG